MFDEFANRPECFSVPDVVAGFEKPKYVSLANGDKVGVAIDEDYRFGVGAGPFVKKRFADADIEFLCTAFGCPDS